MAEGPADVVSSRLVFAVSGETAADVLAQMARRLAEAGVVADGPALARALVERERRCATALGSGIAIPHGKLPGLAGVVVALGLVRPPVSFGAPDGKPVDLVFLLLSPAEAPAANLAALSRLSRILRAPGVAELVREAGSPEAAARALREAEAGLMVSPG